MQKKLAAPHHASMSVIRVALAFFLLLPCACWIWLDKSLWFWDPAMYGLESIRLWRLLTLQPHQYLQAFFHVIGFKAPMISWVGEWFAPLGAVIGYERALLLMQWVASFFILLSVCRWKEFSKSVLTLLVGGFLVASTPIFIFQSHFYFVEVLQTLGVVWVWGLFLRRYEIPVIRLLTGYIFCFFFLLGVKTTSPFYIVLPSLGILYALWSRRSEFLTSPLMSNVNIISLVAAIFCTLTVFIWYLLNWHTVFAFAHSAASGTGALLYGKKADLLTKLKFWFTQFQQLFLGFRADETIIIISSMLSFLLYWRRILNKSFLIALGQLIFVLVVMSFQINEETRYLYPLLVYLLYLSACVITQTRWLQILFLVVFIFRWGDVNFATLGVWPMKSWLPWSDTVDRKGESREQAEEVVRTLWQRTNHRDVLVLGVDTREMNHVALQFTYFTLYSLSTDLPIRSIDYAETDINKARKTIDKLDGAYFLTMPISILQKVDNPWNRVSLALALKIKHEGWQTFAQGNSFMILSRMEERKHANKPLPMVR